MGFKNWFLWRRRDRDLNDEIEAHLAMAVRDRIERGEDAQAAEFAARREFGNRTLVAEITREKWAWHVTRIVWNDAAYALRGLRRSPGFAAVAIASLALGIGANTAIFSLMNAAMLRMLPVREPERLVELLQKYPDEPRLNGGWSWKSYRHIQEQNTVFSDLFGMGIDNAAHLRIEHGGNERGIAEYVTSNYFSSLGVEPALGRAIAGEGSVAVVSWLYWANKFHKDPDIVGKKIFVEDQPATIIGVAPRSFVGLRMEAATDVWLPLRQDPDTTMALLGRLKPGATLSQARAEMAVLYRFTIEEKYARSKDDPLTRRLKVEVEPAGNGLATVRDRFGKPLFVLMTIAGVLLMIACVNIASLLLARGASREREMAVRAGLGASRSRLIAGVLTESLTLSALGTLAAVALAYLATDALLRVLVSGRLHEQVHLRVEPDLHVLMFVAAVAIGGALLFGMVPALNAMRSNPIAAMRQTGSTGETRWKRLFQKSLVAVQVAFSVLLLSTGALFAANLWNLEHTYLGFRRDHMLLVTLEHKENEPQRASNYQELLSRVARLPGVRSASLCGPTPLSGAGASGFANVEGYQERPTERRWIAISYVSPKYFETFGTPLLAGRDFDARDQNGPRVAIINERMARHYFANRNPIGQHITMFHVTLDPQPKTYEVVGVAADANYTEIREPARNAIYLRAFHDGVFVSADNLAVRTNIDPEKIVRDVRSAVGDVLPTVSVMRVITLDAQIDASIVPERLVAMLSGCFAGLGALLAGIGIYGLLAYAVARRTKEIGIRMALGATDGKVSRMVLGEALAIVATGLAVGAPMAIWGRAVAARAIGSMAVPTGFPFGAAVTIILSGAILAAYLPARRAARIDPMEALREE